MCPISDTRRPISDTTIGAGSVVMEDIPTNVFPPVTPVVLFGNYYRSPRRVLPANFQPIAHAVYGNKVQAGVGLQVFTEPGYKDVNAATHCNALVFPD